MGVPSLFISLIRKYPKIIFHDPNLEIDNLYIDFNCGIHPACYRILDKNKNWVDENRLEDKMLAEIISYLDKIIKFVNPKKLIYIAIDGPAPVGKIKQQRQRRYKAALEPVLSCVSHKDRRSRFGGTGSLSWGASGQFHSRTV